MSPRQQLRSPVAVPDSRAPVRAPLANLSSGPGSDPGAGRILSRAPRGAATSTRSRAGKNEKPAKKRQRLAEIVRRLHNEYPEAECALLHANPVQLLVATILSAQCTDERVNQVTPALFRKYPDAASLAAAGQEDLEHAIHSTGFYRNKARNILACCQALVDKHGGEVPRDMESLVALAGVGRKTANVVRGACFGLPAITVDTHCGRLARRLGLSDQVEPEKVERDLQQLLPEDEWWFFSSGIIWHGRRVCLSRRPDCERCVLSNLCPSSLAPVALNHDTPRSF